jgi:hypothetical protein
MKLTDFNNLSNFGIEDPRMTTIGGVAFRHLDRLPVVGDSISIEDITISVLEMDAHRIARARVSRGIRGDEAVAAGALAEPIVAGETADEVQKKPDDEGHKDKMAGSGNDDAHPEPAGAGDAGSKPDLKIVH